MHTLLSPTGHRRAYSVQRHAREKLLAQVKLPPVRGTSARAMQAVLEHLASKGPDDPGRGRLRQYDEQQIARELGTKRSVVAKALAALDTLRIITLSRTAQRISVSINWYALEEFVPLAEGAAR